MAFDFNPDTGAIMKDVRLFDANDATQDAPVFQAGGRYAFRQRFQQVDMGSGNQGTRFFNDVLIADDPGMIVVVNGWTPCVELQIDGDALWRESFMRIYADPGLENQIANEYFVYVAVIAVSLCHAFLFLLVFARVLRFLVGFVNHVIYRPVSGCSGCSMSWLFLS